MTKKLHHDSPMIFTMIYAPIELQIRFHGEDLSTAVNMVSFPFKDNVRFFHIYMNLNQWSKEVTEAAFSLN